MNKRYTTPEIIATVKTVSDEGTDHHLGDKVTGLNVTKEGTESALVQISVHKFKGDTDLVLEIELHELVEAISYATLNAEDQST